MTPEQAKGRGYRTKAYVLDIDRDVRPLSLNDRTHWSETDPEVAAAKESLDEAFYGRCVSCGLLSLRVDGWCSEHRPKDRG